MDQTAGVVLQKKSTHASEQERPDIRARREAWHQDLKHVDRTRLVFLDESGAKTDMARFRGRCPTDQRLVSASPAGHWKITTMLCAVRLDGPFAAAVVDGPTDTDVFLTYVREVLAPRLRSDDVVVMDNLSPHKAAGVKEAIESTGARLMYLPAYSPDYNPIENMWSKVKQHMRGWAARSVEGLYAAIDSALASITPQDCRGFFGHCGYAI